MTSLPLAICSLMVIVMPMDDSQSVAKYFEADCERMESGPMPRFQHSTNVFRIKEVARQCHVKPFRVKANCNG